MAEERRNEALRLNEQSLVSYKYDCYSGAQISLFLGSIWMDDAVAISYTLTDPKTPVYGYASKFYGLVAQGNRIIQGQIAVAYTEDGYFTSIMNRLQAEGRGTILTGSALSATTATSSIAGGDWQTNAGDTVLERLRKVLDALTAAKADYQADPSNTTLKEYIATLEKEKKQLEATTNTQNNTYSRSTIQQRLTDTSGMSLYEDFAEVLEDTTLNPTLMSNIMASKRFQWLIVEGYQGAPKVRRPVEHDLVIKTTTREKVPYETIGDGFDIIIGYGDLSSGPAEHTIKVLRDVHIISEGQVIEANGNPIFEVYQFFARDIAPLEDFRTDKNTAVSRTDGRTNLDNDKTAQGQGPAGRELVALKVAWAPLGVNGKPGLFVDWKAELTKDDKDMVSKLTQAELSGKWWQSLPCWGAVSGAIEEHKNASVYGSEYGIEVILQASFSDKGSAFETLDKWTIPTTIVTSIVSASLVVTWHWSDPADPIAVENGDYTLTYQATFPQSDNITTSNFYTKPQYTLPFQSADLILSPNVSEIYYPGWNIAVVSPWIDKSLQQLHAWFKTDSLRKVGTSPWSVVLKVTYKDASGTDVTKILDTKSGT